MIVEELYDALIEAGASEEKARAASRAIADMEGHFANIEKDIFRLDQKTGGLRATGQVAQVPAPVCLKLTAPFS